MWCDVADWLLRLSRVTGIELTAWHGIVDPEPAGYGEAWAVSATGDTWSWRRHPRASSYVHVEARSAGGSFNLVAHFKDPERVDVVAAGLMTSAMLLRAQLGPS